MRDVLVYGATGSQGAPVARALLGAGHRVRVLTRRPEHAASLHEAGAEVMQGDLDDLESVRRASEGIEVVSLHVPFFTASPHDGPRYAAHALEAARAAGVSLVVWNASGEIPPTRTGNPGFDGRIDVLELIQASGLRHVVLQPTAYMENFLGPWTRAELAEAGTFAYPTPKEVTMQWIATEDVAAHVAYAVAHPELANLVLKIAGPERLNGEGVAERFARALGRPITFRAMPPEEFGEKLDAVFPGMGGPAAQGYKMAYEHPERFSSRVDTEAAQRLMPVPLTPLETWARARKEAFSESAPA